MNVETVFNKFESSREHVFVILDNSHKTPTTDIVFSQAETE